MLEFNPWFRKNSDELLKSTLFDAVRDPAKERPAPQKIEVSIDNLETYDYQSKEYSSTVSLKDMKQLLKNEIKIVKYLKKSKAKL